MSIQPVIEVLGRLFGRGKTASGVQVAGHTNQQAGGNIINVNLPSSHQAAPRGGDLAAPPELKPQRLSSLDEDLLLELSKRAGVLSRSFGYKETLKIGDIEASSESPHRLEQLKAALDRLEAAGLTNAARDSVIQLTNSGRREARVIREQRTILANSLRWYDGLVALDSDREGKIIQFGPFEREYSAEREEAFERLLACGALVDCGSWNYRIAPEWVPRARELQENYLLTPP